MRIYGHMDYGKRAPDLGWRMTDAWLSMAGASSKGLPNGRPIDEWGIRMEEGSCNPAGASVIARRRDQRPGVGLRHREVGRVAAQIRASRAPPTTTSTSRCRRWPRATWPSRSSGTRPSPRPWSRPRAPGNNTVDDKGTPLWRMAPSPHGPYWEEGMKLGYQDAGSWTLFKSTPVDRRKAAWLYAQFTVSKTVSLKKSHVGLTIIRDSDIRHKSFTDRAPKLGGLVEFYRSPDRVMLDADRHQRAGLSEARAALVAEHRRRQLGRLHAAAGDGPAGQGDGPGDGAHGGSRQEGQGLRRLRPAAQRREGSERVARQAERPEGQARQREAARARRSTTTSSSSAGPRAEGVDHTRQAAAGRGAAAPPSASADVVCRVGPRVRHGRRAPTRDARAEERRQARRRGDAHPRDQHRARTGRLQHPSRHHARRQDDADAADGRARCSRPRARSGSAARTSPAFPCRSGTSRWSSSSSSTTRTSRSTRTSPRRCGSRGVDEARSTAGCSSVAELLRLDAHARTGARPSCPAGSSSAPRSPGRWSRTPTSSCSTSRSPISTTSSARSCATSCRSCSRAARARSCTRPTEPVGGAAPGRPHRDAAPGAHHAVRADRAGLPRARPT